MHYNFLKFFIISHFSYQRTLNVYLGDEPATVKDIKKDDILSIRKSTENFYDIFISRGYAEGRVSAKDPEEKTVTVDGYEYEFIDADIFEDIKLGSEYKFRLDLFERVYDVEELASSTKYAIVLKTITSGNWDNIGVRLYLSNGTVKNYELSDKCKICIDGKEVEGKTTIDPLENATKEDLSGRVISYSINSAGKINKIEEVEGTAKTADFDERNSKIGNIILNNSTIVIDASEYYGNDIVNDYLTINNELSKYNERMGNLPQIVVFTKLDLIDNIEEKIQRFKSKIKDNVEIVPISSITRKNVDELIKKVYAKLSTLPKSEPIPVEQEELAIADITSIKIDKLEPNVYELSGGYLNNLQRGIVFNDTQSLAYFQLRLEKDGIMDKLKEAGVQDGDTVIFGSLEYEIYFQEEK